MTRDVPRQGGVHKRRDRVPGSSEERLGLSSGWPYITTQDDARGRKIVARNPGVIHFWWPVGPGKVGCLTDKGKNLIHSRNKTQHPVKKPISSPKMTPAQILKRKGAESCLILVLCLILPSHLINGVSVAAGGSGGSGYFVYSFSTQDTYYNKRLDVWKERKHFCDLSAKKSPQNVTCPDRESVAALINGTLLYLFTNENSSILFLESGNGTSDFSHYAGSFPDLSSAMKRFLPESNPSASTEEASGHTEWRWLWILALPAMVGIICYFVKRIRSKIKKRNPPEDTEHPESHALNDNQESENFIDEQPSEQTSAV
ncbi:uncharacterized protein [Dendropsophus ebraccatus]|uniref:uncharacterized protein n=1 Tax=Dendropsophus ebraccatus TaxID=150705 RepID=UPI00383193FB